MTALVVYRVVLGLSMLVQLAFGLVFLVAPERLLARVGLGLTPGLAGLTVNLGCLILLTASCCLLALRWSSRRPAESRALGALIGVMLVMMGGLQALQGAWAPLLFDGLRGAALLACVARLAREAAAPAVAAGE